jgi:hypothetical protein
MDRHLLVEEGIYYAATQKYLILSKWKETSGSNVLAGLKRAKTPVSVVLRSCIVTFVVLEHIPEGTKTETSQSQVRAEENGTGSQALGLEEFVKTRGR